MNKPLAFLVLLAPLFAASCGEPTLYCPGAVLPAIVVEVTDATTGAWIADGATCTVRDGEYEDSLSAHRWDSSGTLTSLAAAWGRAGSYAVTVQRDGYQPWQRVGVEALAGECGVRTTELRAELMPTT